MQLVVTNTSGRTIAVPDALNTTPSGADLGVYGVNALGGNVVDPLPFPLDDVRSLAAAGTKTLPVHSRDFLRSPMLGDSLSPGQEWNQLVNAGVVTLAWTAVATHRDTTDKAIGTV